MSSVFEIEKKTDLEKSSRRSYPQIVKAWLVLGLVLIFVQVVVGGITRLTGSGLSITKWEIVTGTLPPLNAEQWQEEFILYQDTPQYQKMNEGMSMSDFKFIYFWEYFHRLWARMMGFAFIIPLVYFLVKGYIDRPLLKRLGLVFFAAALTASFGWIMVASGLIERPLVNAYKLSAHLGIAFTTFGILLWTTFWAYDFKLAHKAPSAISRFVMLLAVVVVVQILLGGMMSGMKAALFYPTWPDLNGEYIPALLFDFSNWTFEHFVEYDKHPFTSALVHVLHRNTAYLIVGLVAIFGFRALKLKNLGSNWTIAVWITMLVVLIQVILGIATLLYTAGSVIPVGLGVFHQGVGLLLLAAILYDLWLVRSR